MIDFKKIVEQKHVSFFESTCSLGELDEKPNHTKISNSWNVEIKDSFFHHLAKKNVQWVQNV